MSDQDNRNDQGNRPQNAQNVECWEVFDWKFEAQISKHRNPMVQRWWISKHSSQP